MYCVVSSSFSIGNTTLQQLFRSVFETSLLSKRTAYGCWAKCYGSGSCHPSNGAYSDEGASHRHVTTAMGTQQVLLTYPVFGDLVKLMVEVLSGLESTVHMVVVEPPCG